VKRGKSPQIVAKETAIPGSGNAKERPHGEEREQRERVSNHAEGLGRQRLYSSAWFETPRVEERAAPHHEVVLLPSLTCSQACFSPYVSRKIFLSILPTLVFSRRSTNWIFSGTPNFGMTPRAANASRCALISASFSPPA